MIRYKWIASIFAILFICHCSATSNIDDCLEINHPGKYEITQDIYSKCKCISVNAEDVEIDGDNRKIINNQTSAQYCNGIHAHNVRNLTLKNVELRYFGSSNCDIVDGNPQDLFGEGIKISESNEVRLENIQTSNNCIGIFMDYDENVNISRFNSSSESVGIYLKDSISTHLEDSQISNSKSIGLSVEDSSFNNIKNVNLYNNIIGIYIIGSSNQIIESSLDNQRYDVIVEGGKNNSFLDCKYDLRKEFVDTNEEKDTQLIRRWSVDIIIEKYSAKILATITDIFGNTLYWNKMEKESKMSGSVIEYINEGERKYYGPYNISILKKGKKILEEIQFNVTDKMKIDL